MTWAESGWTVTARLNWTCCWPFESPFDDWCEPSLLKKCKQINIFSNKVSFLNLTFQVLFQLNDIVREMQQDEHNKLVLVLIPNVYIWHMYDKVDKLKLEVHQQKNYYHPKEHDNVMVEMYLEYQHVNIDKNHIQLDVLLPHQPLCLVVYFHFFHTRKKSTFVYLDMIRLF
jgi:hypothetical protein